MSTTPTEPRAKLILLLCCVLVNCSGLFVTIIGPDGALYAGISKTMVQQNDFIGLYAEGKDWLDKPHFPFWMAALSFKIFGFTTWAYKFPAILFLLAAAAYTYAFAKRLYDKEVAFWSVIVMLTAEHIILSNNDVRAEPYLTGLIIASVYHFYVARTKKHWGHLIAGSLFAACAVMTKGMFALIPIGGAIAGELIIKRKWHELFHIRWLVALVMIVVFITPELYCLYRQFDAHPEKIVFGRTGVSGIRFFFWDSQFGRFFNTGPIKGKGDPFFFVHTLLWAFLPWSLLLYAAITRKFRKGYKQVMQHEWYTISGALLTFLLFSASSFQLPHYMNIVFPFFAIITAQYVLSLKSGRTIKTINTIQIVLMALLILMAGVLHFFFRPGNTVLLAVMLLLAAIAVIYFRSASQVNIFIKSALVVIAVNLYLNLFFYPALLKYQSGSEAAFYINKNYPGKTVVQLREQNSYALGFYLNAPLVTVDNLEQLTPPYESFIIYASETATVRGDMSSIRSFDHFHISRLTPRLLNHATRKQELEHFTLLHYP